MPEDETYPFSELRFIIRALSGEAPEEDRQTAYGMAKEIFAKWHSEKLDQQKERDERRTTS